MAPGPDFQPPSTRCRWEYLILRPLVERIRGTFRGSYGSRPAENDAGTLLEEVIADLGRLNRSTEQDFIVLGNHLAEFLTAARQISADTTALRELLSGRDSEHASQVLTSLVERLRQTEAQAVAGDRTLATVCDSARQIGRTFEGFRDTVAMFRALGSLIRIETARLGSAGAEFGNLAEDVNAVTQRIDSSGQAILESSSILHLKMHSALSAVAGLRANGLKQLPSLTANVMSSLESLEERNRRVSEAALRQSAEYDEVSAAIEDVIPAIQFNDITRQKLEHVAEALGQLRPSLGAGATARLTDRRVVALQSSQLASAERVFASSVGRIKQDLDNIARRLASMAETSKSLMGCSADEQGSFFSEMEERFSTILTILSSCAKADAQTQSALSELESTVTNLRNSVEEVRQIGIHIHRIAINATIRAVQLTGESGNALSVLAEVMQRLAVDSGAITGQVAEALDLITAAGDDLSTGSGWTAAGTNAAGDAILSEMQGTISDLHTASESGFNRLYQIIALSSKLSEGIESVQAGFSADRALAEVANRACGTLEQLAGRIPAGAGDVETGANQDLAELAAHYTMEAEREVHDSMASSTSTAPANAEGAPKAGSGDEELGDNVELF